MFTLAWILISTFLVSVISLIGILFLAVKENILKKFVLVLVSFASGSLLGGAFFHLIPESFSTLDESVFITVVFGIMLFFLLEKCLWRHCHERECPVHPFAYLNFLGDGIHNFIDGIVIAASFLSAESLGLITTVAVVMHEIPQELGDFGVLIYGGFTKAKALLFNFVSAILAMAGALFTYFFISYLPNTNYILGFAAGGFIYIATTDLIPELHKETNIKNSIVEIVFLLLGVILMKFLKV
ncbi:MAG: ZIP family metal transporter [Candidatus Bathyarchaeota archaeon]|nr:ZIP family metal transporter [Candidatus Bathyarchaeota archaeon]MDH5494626.1 ZIP family metal transporter [Candidatus Bathyarchaeota archaeon]